MSFDRSTFGSLDGIDGFPTLRGIGFIGPGITRVPDTPVLPGIVQLGIRSPDLQDLTGIARFPNVETLRVMNSAIVSFEGLEACPNIKKIDASLCRSLGSLRGLQNARKLEEMDVSTTHVYWGGEDRTPGRLASLRGLDNCESLVELNAIGHAITSMKGIEHCTRMRRLFLDRNRITRIEGLDGLPELAVLRVAGNPLDSLDGVQAAARTLVSINLSDTAVRTLEPLRGFPVLDSVDAENTLVSSLEPLGSCPCLIEVQVSGSPVTSLHGLETMGRYAPTIVAKDCKLTSLEGLPKRKVFQAVNLNGNDIPEEVLRRFYKRVRILP